MCALRVKYLARVELMHGRGLWKNSENPTSSQLHFPQRTSTNFLFTTCLAESDAYGRAIATLSMPFTVSSCFGRSSSGTRKSSEQIVDYLRNHPSSVATSWYTWSKHGQTDLLQAAHDLVMQEGADMQKRGDFGIALAGLDTCAPAAILAFLLRARSNYGRTPLVAAARAGKLEAVKLLLTWVRINAQPTIMEYS